MIHRTVRTYLAAIAVVLLFLTIIPLLHYSGAADVQGTVSGWRDHVWSPHGDEPSEVVEEPEKFESQVGNEKEEVPLPEPVTVTVTATAEASTVTVSTTITQTASAAAQPFKNMNLWTAQRLAVTNVTFEVADDITYDPAGPKPDQVVLLTAADGKGHSVGIENIMEQTEQNRKAYCDYHGYNYHFVNISQYDMADAHPVWKKLPAIVDAFNTFPDAQWVFFLDLDAIIMSPKQDLNSLVLSREGLKNSLYFGVEWRTNHGGLGEYMQPDADLDNIDFLIAQDHNGMNAGSFFIRRSQYSRWMIDMWADPFYMKNQWQGQEQTALLHMFMHHRTFREHTGLIKMGVANAYPKGWSKGLLIVHFAGCWVNNNCAQLWKEFWDKHEVLP